MDSVIALFRVDFSGRGELAERQVFSSVHCEAIVKKVEGHYFIFLLMGISVSGMKLQQKLAQMLSRLTKIAEEFNVAVYITNQGELFCLALYLFQEFNNNEFQIITCLLLCSSDC